MSNTEPPYLRIAADIKARIAAGELQPGVKIPSTRAIAAQWQVALATATKALTTLRHEGVVRAVPRVGTVVADQAKRRLPRPVLAASGAPTRRHIVAAARAIADSEGISAVSMRAVAAQIGGSTMSLYRYVESKDDLIQYMIDAAFAELGEPAESPLWRDRLASIAHELWALFRRHPWLSQVVSLTRVQPVPGLFRYVDTVMGALRGLGLDSHTKLYIHMSMFSYVQGLASNLELEAQTEGETGVGEQEWMNSVEPSLADIWRSGDYPNFASVVTALDGGYDQDLDVLFEFGLATLLDGFAVRLAHLDG